jgi:hypothetical protein
MKRTVQYVVDRTINMRVAGDQGEGVETGHLRSFDVGGPGPATIPPTLSEHWQFEDNAFLRMRMRRKAV